MAERTVLIIAYYFPPMGLSGVQRTLKFVKYLPENGWKPVVLTTAPTSFYAFDDTLDDDLRNEEIYIYRTAPKSADDLQSPKILKFRSYFIQRLGRAFLQTIYQPDRFIKWKKSALLLSEKIFAQHKIDVVFATAPPFTDFILAQEISKKFNVPFVADYRDLWVDNPYHFYATPFHKNYSIKLEKELLTTAEKIVVVTRHSKEVMLKRYGFLSHNDIAIIPHGYDPEDFYSAGKIKPNPLKFTITHSGLFQDDRTPKYFFKALSNFLKKHNEAKDVLEARFLGIMRKGHAKLIKKMNLSNNVVLKGYVNHSDVINNLLESDVLWLMQNDVVRSPGKLFEYFGAKKPILACIPDGVLRKIALDTKATLVTNPKDVIAIEHAIETFYNLWKNKSLPLTDNEYTEQFNRKILTNELSKELALATDL